MTTIIIFGASGQLGQCLKKVTENVTGLSFYFLPEAEANILDKALLKNVFDMYKPSYIINCAAYTAVDKAEDDAETALKINKTGVENLAEFCTEHNAIFIHISTDFVFKGNTAHPLTETDATEPISVYGQTKLDGEKVIVDTLKKYFIIRTGWLYSEYANNFVKTMLKLGAERDELKVIADQVGTPTYAIDLANCIIEIIKSNSTAYGVYHYSNEGITSWYDFARAIFDIAQTKVKVIPVKTSEYITKATRPPYSVMDKSKIKNQFGMEIPYWRDSLINCINKLQQN